MICCQAAPDLRRIVGGNCKSLLVTGVLRASCVDPVEEVLCRSRRVHQRSRADDVGIARREQLAIRREYTSEIGRDTLGRNALDFVRARRSRKSRERTRKARKSWAIGMKFAVAYP